MAVGACGRDLAESFPGVLLRKTLRHWPFQALPRFAMDHSACCSCRSFELTCARLLARAPSRVPSLAHGSQQTANLCTEKSDGSALEACKPPHMALLEVFFPRGIVPRLTRHHGSFRAHTQLPQPHARMDDNFGVAVVNIVDSSEPQCTVRSCILRFLD